MERKSESRRRDRAVDRTEDEMVEGIRDAFPVHVEYQDA